MAKIYTAGGNVTVAGTTTVSAGAADVGKVALLDGTGRLDPSAASSLGLYSTADVATRSGWADLTEPTGGLTPAQSHVASGTSVILKSKAITDLFDNATMTPVGIAKMHNQRNFVATFAFTGFAGQTALAATKFWRLLVGQTFNGWGTQSSWHGAGLNALNGAGDGWYCYKIHKRSHVTTAIYGDLHTLQVALAPVLTQFWFRYEWAESLGYKCWYSTDGAAYTEMGGGAVPLGYVDPRVAPIGVPVANTTSPMFGSRYLVCLIGNNNAEATACEVKLDSLVITGAS